MSYIDWAPRESLRDVPAGWPNVTTRQYQPVQREWLDEPGYWSWALALWARGIATVVSS